MELVSLKLFQTVYQAGRPTTHIYFPAGSIVSMTLTGKGGTVEVAIIGREGVAGLWVCQGADSYPTVMTCQLAGHALRMQAADFRKAVQESAPLRSTIDRYAAYLMVQSFRSTGCNRLHPAEQRLCRWLLMTHDRAGADTFSMTHEFLARMLGVRRPTVSLVANAIQKAGLIRYSRGKVTVLDRRGLEAAACDCYAADRKERRRLLG